MGIKDCNLTKHVIININGLDLHLSHYRASLAAFSISGKHAALPPLTITKA